jgi:hypothetical protein
MRSSTPYAKVDEHSASETRPPIVLTVNHQSCGDFWRGFGVSMVRVIWRGLTADLGMSVDVADRIAE